MPNELPEINTILHSGALAFGNWGRKFEEKLSEYIDNPNVVVVNSYNSAVLVTLITLGIKVGDEVIASPMSCLASNQPFATQGIKVIWADIDPNTGTLSPESVEQKITSKTKAIFHNHHCGFPGYIDEIKKIGKSHGILVVEDAIEAFGSRYKDSTIGNTDSDATIFSFQTVRLPNTIDGGAIVFNDTKLLERAKLIRDLGVDRKKFRDNLGEISRECDIEVPGYGATLSEINSYIGCRQLDDYHVLLKNQRENAEVWKGIIDAEYPKYTILGESYHNPNYWIFGVLVPNKRETILHFRKQGYYASGVHLPNSNYSVFGSQGKFPGVEEFYSKFVALPSGWWFSLKELYRV
jgi:dTDP-4-amino-4,6-dideoxygalactose transaminase